jgi:hypothetical protein
VNSVIDRLAQSEAPIPFDPDKGIYFRVMPGYLRDQWEEHIVAIEQETGKTPRSIVYATLIVMTACDAKGEPLFTVGQEQDLSKRLSHKLLRRMFNKALEVNRIGEEGVEAEKKDSAPAPSFDSGSSSPALSARV